MARPTRPTFPALPLAAALLAAALAGGPAFAPPARADMEAGRAAFRAGDHATALAEFRKSADAGDAGAQYLVGQMMATGQGTARDVPGALRWLESAAAKGSVEAMAAAGSLYASGDGVKADFDRAFALLKPAAEAGSADARNNLAVLYYFGLGTKPDPVEALVWVMRAERQGMLQSIRLRAEIERELTPAQKAEAQRRLEQQPDAKAAGSKVTPPDAAPAPAAPAAMAAVRPVPPATPPATPGASTGPAQPWMVQLGALPSEAEARREWESIRRRHGTIAPAGEPRYVPIDLGPRGTYTRILAGSYPTAEEAEGVCARFKAAGQDCLVRRR